MASKLRMLISKEKRNDPEYVLEALRNDPKALMFASDKLLNDKEFIEKAMHVNSIALEYASERLKNDEDFMESARYFKKWDDPEYVLEVIRTKLSRYYILIRRKRQVERRS